MLGGKGKFDGRLTLVINRMRPRDAWFHWLWDSSEDFGMENPEVKAWQLTPGNKHEAGFAATDRDEGGRAFLRDVVRASGRTVHPC